MLGDWTICASL